MVKAFAARCMAALFALQVAVPAGAAVAPARAPLIAKDASGRTAFGLPDGSRITIGADGSGERTNAAGTKSQPVMLVRPNARTAMESQPGPGDIAIAERLASAHPGTYRPGEVVVSFRSGVSVSGIATTIASHRRLATAPIGDMQLAHALDKLRPLGMRPLFDRMPLSVPAIAQTYVLRIGAGSALAAARQLRGLNSVAYASPNYYVSSFKTDPVRMPDWETHRATQLQSSLRVRSTMAASAAQVSPVKLPTNYGLTSSLQSFLNSTSVDAVGAYEQIASRYGQLPGQGERITNVSIGDLTDQSMADNGDFYVQYYGPTTIVQGGQRYLDIPSMPLIPTYTANMSGQLNPTGSAEYMDPFLGEVLLDFSVMAPLPHDVQRPNALGAGDTDLLGIAPGAQYRLIVPEQPTFANIDTALLAAATQVPRPDVITASLGFGTDGIGFPGRYLEDDPLTEAIVSAIVQQYGVVVCISSNDGTRLYTNEPVNPDGGSTPTDVIAPGGMPTNVGDDATSTTPSEVFDSGAIAAGGSTLDDIFAAPPVLGSTLSTENAFPETRIDGSLNFSSGFGSRVNVSAPSDNIPSMVHYCTSSPCTAQSVVSVLEGGTSASSPEIAAAAAVVLQAGRLAGKHLTPADVRTILESTGRVLPNAPQLDRQVHVGPQIDLTAAVSSLLRTNNGRPSIARVAIAERQNIGNIGGDAVESTDPSNIDLAGPSINGSIFGDKSGLNQVSPITIAPDWQNVPLGAAYNLSINGKTVSTARTARLLPERILNAAGLPLVSTSSRTVTLVYKALEGKAVLTSATFTLTFAPNDGTYIEAQAPIVPASVKVGKSVTVNYDISHVRAQSNGITLMSNPQLIVSSVGHWNPINAPYFRIAYSVPLTQPKGSVTIPASVFAAGGGGIYGVGIEQNPDLRLVGEFAPFLVEGNSTQRPAAPTLSFGPTDPQLSHTLTVTRAQPQFELHYDVSNVRGATGAMLEISAPGPTLGNLLNIFSNAFGTTRDNNGVDSGSVVYQPLSGTRGSVMLDATRLQLPSSLQYNVRVLPTMGTSVVGEASPVSSLQYFDGITPGDAWVTSFDISPQGTSTVGTVMFDGNGNVLDSGIFPYDTATGTFQTPFVEDPNGKNEYYVFGHDPQLNQTTAVDFGILPPTGMVTTPPQTILAFNDANGTVAASASIDPSTNETIAAALLDQVRHRFALLTYNFYAGDAQVFPFALQGGTLGSPITVGTRTTGRLPTMFDIDQSTGQLYLAAVGGGDNCFIFRNGTVTSLNIDTQAISHSGRVPGCLADITSDQSGGSVYLSTGALESVGGLPAFPSNLLPLQESSLTIGSFMAMPDRGAYLSGVDPVHKVLLEGFVASNDLRVNNNAMSAVDVIDMQTGTTLKHMPTFGFLYPLATGVPYTEHGIQVDPAHRTAWTFGAGGDTVQQFTY